MGELYDLQRDLDERIRRERGSVGLALFRARRLRYRLWLIVRWRFQGIIGHTVLLLQRLCAHDVGMFSEDLTLRICSFCGYCEATDDDLRGDIERADEDA